MAKWRLSWPSLLPLPLSLPLSTLLSSRAITHIFYDIALLPSPLSLALFTVRRKKRFRLPPRRLSPLSPLMLHHHRDTERGRQRNGSPPLSLRQVQCTRFISNGRRGGGIGGHHHQVLCSIFPHIATCDANFEFESKNDGCQDGDGLMGGRGSVRVVRRYGH